MYRTKGFLYEFTSYFLGDASVGTYTPFILPILPIKNDGISSRDDVYVHRRSYESRDRCSWCCWMPQRRRKRQPFFWGGFNLWTALRGHIFGSCFVTRFFEFFFICCLFICSGLFWLRLFGSCFLCSFFWAFCLSIIFISLRNLFSSIFFSPRWGFRLCLMTLEDPIFRHTHIGLELA